MVITQDTFQSFRIEWPHFGEIILGYIGVLQQMHFNSNVIICLSRIGVFVRR
jgi:hypothetical protein